MILKSSKTITKISNKKIYIYLPFQKVLEQPWIHSTSLKLCRSSQIPPSSSRVASAFNRTKPTTIGLIISHTLHTLNYLARNKTEGKLVNPWDNTRKSWTHLSPSILSLTSGTKRFTLDSPSILISFSYTRKKKKNPSPKWISVTRVTNSWAVAYKSWMARCSSCDQGL